MRRFEQGVRCGNTAALTTVLLGLAGCSTSSSVGPPDVDSQAATAYAMEHFDTNDDNTLEPTELTGCPALATARTSFDTNGDLRLSANEIADGLTGMYASGMRPSEINCTVTLNGQPLVGAKVRLHPIEMLGDALPSAEGMTDELGIARPTISAELLPDDFRQTPLMYPGLYRVEITHPQTQLAGRYNTATELGCHVDPAARGGNSAQFDLKLK